MASAVNYHFGGREGLVTSAFSLASRRAASWRRRWSLEPSLALPAEAFAGWFVAAMEDYAFTEAPVRAVLRELYLDAGRSTLRLELARAEHEAADVFWTAILDVFGLPNARAGLVADFADGMAILHNHRPTMPEHLGWFGETCSRFSARILGQSERAGWDGWRQRLRSQTVLSVDHDVASSLLVNAADIVGRQGLGSLTHRAVAAQSDVTLAAVMRHFPTRAALVKAVFEAIIASLLTQPSPDRPRVGQVDADILALGVAATTFTPEGTPMSAIMVIEELLGAAGREAWLRDDVLPLRAARGETSWIFLASLPGGSALDELDAHIFSTMTFGAIRAGFTRERPDRRNWLAGRIRTQCDWLTEHEFVRPNRGPTVPTGDVSAEP